MMTSPRGAKKGSNDHQISDRGSVPVAHEAFLSPPSFAVVRPQMEDITNPLLAGTPTAADNLRAWFANPQRRIGDVFAGVRQSDFLACDLKGAEFTRGLGQTSDDPVGEVTYTRDPSDLHEAIVDGFRFLFSALLQGIGLKWGTHYQSLGSGRCAFGEGSYREADCSFVFTATYKEGGPRGLAVEVGVTQSLASLKAKLAQWVGAWPGGGRASLAIGIDVAKSEDDKWILTAYKATPPTPQAAMVAAITEEICVVEGTDCRREGDARSFLWVPLPPLVQAHYSAWYVAWLGLRLAIQGFWSGVWAFFTMDPWTASASAWARLKAPWYAVPVDLFRLMQVARSRE